MKAAVTREEEIFVTLVIQQLSIVFHAMRNELTINPEGYLAVFLLPNPLAVWNRLKGIQNDAFVEFIEACRNWK